MRRVLNILLVATCLLSAHAAAQEVECYLFDGLDLRRLTFTFSSPVGYALTGETIVGQLPAFVRGAGMTPDGELLALDPSTSRLVSIDTNTAEVATVVSLNITGALDHSDIAVLAPGQIYLSQETRLYSLNRATGDVSLIGDTGFAIETLGSSGSTLYAIGSSTSAPVGAFLLLNPSTAQATVIAEYQSPPEINALSSSSPQLWGAAWSHDPWGASLIEVGLMDPLSGQFSRLWLNYGEVIPLVSAVEVRGPAQQVRAVPVLGRSALALLVVVLAAAGVVAIRKLVG